MIGCQPALFSGYDRSWTDLRLIQFDEEGDNTACVAPTEPIDVNYEDKVVMVRSGECKVDVKWETLKKLRAKGIIVVQQTPGAWPGVMEATTTELVEEQKSVNGIGGPACMTTHECWTLFEDKTNVQISFETYGKYDETDERLRNYITAVSFWGSSCQDLPQVCERKEPAAQATFNPQTSGQTYGEAVVIEASSDFVSACLDRDQCVASTQACTQCHDCWALPQEIKNPDRLRDKIALVKLDGSSPCISQFYQHVWYAQKAGALGFVLVNAAEDLTTAWPHQVPVEITIPFVNIMNSYGSELISRIKEGESIRISIPALSYDFPDCTSSSAVCIASGPPIELGYSAGSRLFQTTGIGLLSSTGVARVFEAGQADFNPKNLVSTDPQSAFAVNATLVTAQFASTCSLERYLAPGQAVNSSSCYPCTSALDAALSSESPVSGKVVLVHLKDITCVGSYRTIVDLLHDKGAAGVLFGATQELTITMHAAGEDGKGYTAAIPAFAIKASTAKWIEDQNDPAGSWRGCPTCSIDVLLPKLDALGQAAEYAVISQALGEPVDGCEDGARKWAPMSIMIQDPPAVRGRLAVGGAGFNPSSWEPGSSRQAPAVMAQWTLCGDFTRCMQCDALICSDLVNKDDMMGRIMLHWRADALCLAAHEVAKCAQEAGAVALIYMSMDSEIITLPPSRKCLPRDWPAFTLPTFNLPSSDAAPQRWRNLLTCEEMSISIAFTWKGDIVRCRKELSASPVMNIKIYGYDGPASVLPTHSTGSGATPDERYIAAEARQEKFPIWAMVLLACAFLLVNLVGRTLKSILYSNYVQ